MPVPGSVSLHREGLFSFTCSVYVLLNGGTEQLSVYWSSER